MIYVCVTARNHAATVGLVLWKVRQVFSVFPREFLFLVADDGSTDATAEVLATYQRVLPLSLMHPAEARGPAMTTEALLRDALARSDRPKRDMAITLHPDFTVSPESLPLLARAIESGADLAVLEALSAEPTLAHRLVRRSAPWLLRPGVRVPGVRDLLSGVCAIRLSTLRHSLRDPGQTLFQTDGPCAYAELVARMAAVARQITVVSAPPSRTAGAPSGSALRLALSLIRAGRRLRVPPPAVEVRRAS